MDLKPLFQSESDAEHWKTIKENLGQIKSSLWASETSVMAEKLQSYTYAVMIDDSIVRARVVELIEGIAYAKKQHLGATQAIDCVIRQIESKTE